MGGGGYGEIQRSKRSFLFERRTAMRWKFEGLWGRGETGKGAKPDGLKTIEGGGQIRDLLKKET